MDHKITLKLIKTLFLFLTCLTALSVQSPTENPFEEFGFSEMNKLNSAALFKTHEYMLAVVTEDKDCEGADCKEAIELVLKTIAEVQEKVQVQPVWINSMDNKKLVKKLRIVESESIVYLANGRAVVYQGDWDLENLSVWLKKRVILPSVGFSKFDELEPMYNQYDLVVTYGGIRSQYYKMFRYIAGTYDDLHFAHSFSAPVSFDNENGNLSNFLQILKSMNRTVTFSKHFAKTSYQLKAPFTMDQLTNFIDGHYYSLKYMHKRTLKRVMTIEPATLLFVHTDPSSTENVNFALASEDLKRELLCVSTPVTLDKHVKRLMRFLGLIGPHIKYKKDRTIEEALKKDGKEKTKRDKEEDLKKFHPLVGGRLFILQRNEDRVIKYKWDGKTTSKKSLMSAEDVKNFYNDWRNGLLKPFYKSMPLSSIPRVENSPIKTLVGENFEQTVYNDDKDVVVFFHSVWCLDCPEALTEYEKLAEAFSKYDDVIFAKIDSFHNEGEFIPEGIIGEPVLRVFKAGAARGEGVSFEGAYVQDELKKFVANNLDLSIEDL